MGRAREHNNKGEWMKALTTPVLWFLKWCKGAKGKEVRVSNTYLIHSVAPNKNTSEPIVDIILASDRAKAEGLFLEEYPNAVETLIKSELIATDVARAEGALKFDLDDELYWELWEAVGDEKILQVLRDAEANATC